MVKCLECEKSAGSVAHGRKSGPVTVTPDDLKKTRKSLLVNREMDQPKQEESVADARAVHT